MTTFADCVFRSHPTGSRYICNPAPTDTDNDTVFLVNGFYDWREMLINAGWEQCGHYEFAGRFEAFRKGEENWIITEDEDFFHRYIFATEGARALNLLNKDDRIKLFVAISEASLGYAGFMDKFPDNNVLDNLFAGIQFNEVAPAVWEPLVPLNDPEEVQF